MSESGKLRLVRCPKCQNLLPELADYYVYQCGGCGAVLRAKNKPQETDCLSENNDEERAPKNLMEEGQVNPGDASNAGVKLNAGHLEDDDVGYAERNGDQSEMQATNTGVDTNVNRDEVSHLKGREQEESVSQIDYTSGSHRSGKMSNWRTGERGKMEELRRNPRSHAEGMRYTTSNYMDEGPSNHANSSYSFGEPVWTRNDPDGVQRVKYLEQDRVELLRKLDELKDQLSRSCDVGDKPKKKKVPTATLR